MKKTNAELLNSLFKTLANQISPFSRAKASPIKMVHEDVARLIYLYLGKQENFSAFHC